jgi:hypothetical protein
MVTLPIGGADMPVVISLFNALTGLAVAFEGFVLNNAAMIIAGTVVGSLFYSNPKNNLLLQTADKYSFATGLTDHSNRYFDLSVYFSVFYSGSVQFYP